MSEARGDMAVKDPKKALVYGLATVLMWSTVATAFKLSLRHYSPTQLLLVSSLVSIAVLAAVAAYRGALRSAWPALRGRPGLYLGLGLLNPCLYYLTLFEAYDRLPAQQAQPLNYTWAITLTLLAVPLLGQTVRRSDWIACLLGYLGVVVITTRGDVFALQFDDPIGVALALISTVIWALYWIANTRDPADPVVGLLLCFVCGLPGIVVANALLSDFDLSDLRGLAGAVYIGVFEMGLAFVLWLLALKNAENTARVSNLIFIAPFISLYLIATVLGEAIHPSVFVGLVLILAGLIVQQLGKPGLAAGA